MKTFTTKDGQKHRIDDSGNHFIGIKCINPTCASGLEIGDTVPSIELIDVETVRTSKAS